MGMGPYWEGGGAGGGEVGANVAANTMLAAEVLNEKEEKVLELIAEGMSNRQIGSALFLAEGTVKNYVSRIMDKLHANTRTELAMKMTKVTIPPAPKLP